MGIGNPFRRIRAIAAVASFGLFFFVQPQLALGGPQEQQSSQGKEQTSPPPQNPPPPAPAQDPAAPKRRKIWTNDDVVSLRTPADTYQAEKEAQQAADEAAAAKKAELTRQLKDAGLKIKLPATAEETRRVIKAKEEQIRDIQDALNRLSHDLPDAPEEQKSRIQEQIESLTAESRKAQLELKALQDHLESFPKSRPNEPSSETPPAPPNPNP